MSGFLTPHFELSQDDEFVRVRIRLPHLRTDEGEFYVLDNEFKFYLKPYFLRLTFRNRLVEDGRERAEHDLSTSMLTVWLPKETHGQHFDDLGMLSELLRKPAPPERTRGPLIEVLSSTSAAGEGDDGMDGSGAGTSEGRSATVADSAAAEEGEEEGEEEDDGGWMAMADQALPPLSAGGASYGFNGAYSGVFAGLDDTELLLLQV